MSVFTQEGKTTWELHGDWFDLCNCSLPCACTFAQPPDKGKCYGLLAYKINSGRFGSINLSGLTVITISLIITETAYRDDPGVGQYYLLIDERATPQQREALERLWTSKEGGGIAALVGAMGELKRIEYVPIECKIEADLARWSLQVPGRVMGTVEALTGPTTPPGTRVQTFNPPASETGGSPATWGVPTGMELVNFGDLSDWVATSSKHIPFDWKND